MSIQDKVMMTFFTVLIGGIGEGLIFTLCFSPNSGIPPELAILGAIVILFAVIGSIIYIFKP